MEPVYCGVRMQYYGISSGTLSAAAELSVDGVVPSSN